MDITTGTNAGVQVTVPGVSGQLGLAFETIEVFLEGGAGLGAGISGSIYYVF